MELIGEYKLIRPLARGGMADLYLAEKQGPGEFVKTVVIKRVTKALLNDDEVGAMFLDEARVHGQLHHPHIVQLFDLKEDKNAYYMVLEYVPGWDLHQLITGMKPLEQSVRAGLALPIICNVLDALHFAHHLAVIHRDISPGNILISTTGAAKLCDFGVAKSDLQQTFTKTGFTKGKFRYMAPEQLEGGLIDPRADLFSIGVCLYETITGKKLFGQAKDEDVIQAIRSGRYPIVLSLPGNLHSPIKTLLQRALMSSPKDRFQSARDFGLQCAEVLATLHSIEKPLFWGDYFGDEAVDHSPSKGQSKKLGRFRRLIGNLSKLSQG